MPFWDKRKPQKDEGSQELYTINPNRFMRFRCRNCKQRFLVDTEAEENYTTDDDLPPIHDYCPDCEKKLQG